MNDRDMYYGGYGYGGFTPIGSTNTLSNMGMIPQINNTPNNYTTGMYNDMNNRLERLERQVKRLDQRLTRLETPYANSNNNEPDNNMYIM